MAHLDISTFSGHQQSLELDKRQAVSIGTHPSNDVQVEGDDVETMHCRISWNKKGFEVVAAGSDGVSVNGTLVQKAQLQPGDVMRIGDSDVQFRDGDEAAAAPAQEKDADESDLFGLVPLSGEIDIPLPPPKEKSPPPPAPAPDEPLTADEIDLADLEEIEEASKKRKRSKEKRKRSEETSDKERRERKRDRAEKRERSEPEKRTSKDRQESRRPEPEPEVDDDIDLEALAADVEETPKPAKAIRRSTEAATDESFDERDADDTAEPAPIEKVSLRQRLHSRPRRPGEHDPVRSPLVLTLGGGAALLVLVGLTFYFIINRQTTQERFDAAQSEMDEGKYSQAIKAFEQFIAVYPKDSLADKAKAQLGISKIERHISGASPNWPEGLKELNAFINARRDLPDFEELSDGVRRRAQLIAEGAAISAGKVYDRGLLATSDEARNLLTRYAPEGAATADIVKRIQTSWRTSEAAILKHETLTASIAVIDKAIAEKRPMDALVERRELIRRYPDFESDKRIVAKLTEILKTEQALVTRDDEPVDALTDEHPSDVPAPLTLAFHARSRTDEVSVGENVFTLSKDCCYAVDSITGSPVWRRVIGWDAPFFPEPVSAAVDALLVFSTRHDELQLLDQKDGRLIWRQPAVKGVDGPPTVEEGQIYVVSRPGILNKIDLASGQVTSRLKFSQKILSPPTPLLDGARLVVAGSQEVIYTLTNRPLDCAAVTYFGHKPESVVAPLLPMGALVLMCENQPGETSLLRVLDSRKGDKLSQIVSATIPGHVIDPPVIRGRDVFVPSSGERVSSFSASDEPGQTPLSVGPRYEPEGAEQSPMFLSTGPDRKVWMASRYLRQLQLTTDAIQPGSKVVNLGMATQPIQQRGRKLYVGRALPYSSSTTLFQADRDELASDWQTVVGAKLIGWGSYPDQTGLVAVNESGDVFRIGDDELAGGGFLSTTTVRLKLPEELEDELGARQLSDGTIAVWCGDPQPQLWTLNRVGQTDRPIPLPGPLECSPVLLGGRVVAPVAGQLHLLRSNSGDKPVQEFSLPQAQEQTPSWRQMVRIDDSTLLAATGVGTLYQVRLQSSPQTFLAESGRVELGEPLEFQMGSGGGAIAVATGQQLQLLDAATLEPRAKVELPSPVSNDVWIAGDRVFVETSRQELHAYQMADGLTESYSIPLEGTPVAGAPLMAGGRLLVPLTDGRVLFLDGATGEVTGQKVVGQALSEGSRLIGQSVITATVDGSLVRVGSLTESQ